MHVSWGEICHFKHPAHFGGKSHDHQDFSREKTRTKPSFSRPNFNAYFNVDYNRDLEPEQEIKTMETNFVGRKTWKDYSGSKKMRSARGHQSKNEQQWEKVNRNIYIFPLKKNVYLGSFWKLWSCKTMAKKWTKKCGYMCKVVVFFFAN